MRSSGYTSLTLLLQYHRYPAITFDTRTTSIAPSVPSLDVQLARDERSCLRFGGVDDLTVAVASFSSAFIVSLLFPLGLGQRGLGQRGSKVDTLMALVACGLEIHLVGQRAWCYVRSACEQVMRNQNLVSTVAMHACFIVYL